MSTPNFSADCRQAILSENDIDFFVQYEDTAEQKAKEMNAVCYHDLGNHLAIMYFNSKDPKEVQESIYLYSIFPKCYGLMDTSHLEPSGVNKIRRQPNLNLSGSGVLIGFVDTGIDYRNDVFKYDDNTTRIVSIWDQTIQTGSLPENYLYGSEYTRDNINEALTAPDPLTVVPSTDDNGHGTFLASVAAGNIDRKNDFSGVAPLSELVIVKLKGAKKVLRDYYYINENAIVYQESDILLGISYLLDKSRELKKPIVICLGMGTNYGGHEGRGILATYLTMISTLYETCIILPAGNESNYGLHYQGNIKKEETFRDIEINVGPDERGFVVEFWAFPPSFYTVGFFSPSGESIPKILPKIDENQIFTFSFEKTRILVDYRVVELRTGNELIFIRFENPSEGIWKIRVYPEQNFETDFNLWLPIREFLSSDTRFLNPDPNVTVTDPGNAPGPITVAAHNHTTRAIFINSGRGFTASNQIKPDISSPGVNIFGALPDNQFSVRTGTSVAAAVTAGAAALIMEWGIIKNARMFINTTDIKAFLIKGANRTDTITYPSREFGYGTLNVYEALSSLRYTN